MMTTRRDWLKGLVATIGLDAVGGGRFLFAAPPGWMPGATPASALTAGHRPPNLILGVISDTHLRTNHAGKKDSRYTDRHFISALRLFREADVDAVVHCGDMAHCGQLEEMQFHADAWQKVFPGDKGKSGRKVERLFVSGNHDLEASEYGIGSLVKRLYPDEEERSRHLLSSDIAGNWERIWGEPYERAWHRTVKGYHFFGRHWGVPDDEYEDVIRGEWPCGGDAAAHTCVFLMSHRPPESTLRTLLRRRCRETDANAVFFSGHYHLTSANWNMATMFNESGPLACLSCPACFSSRGDNHVGWNDSDIARVPISGGKDVPKGPGRECYIVKVSDDRVEIERHEVSHGGLIGANWVLPLGWKEDEHPFSRAELKKIVGTPQFAKNAKLTVERVKLESGEDAVRLSIPLADGNPDSRVYAYEIVVAGEEGAPKLFKAVYANGLNMGMGHEPQDGVTTLRIPASELPPGTERAVAVRPLSSLGTSGGAVAAKYTT